MFSYSLIKRISLALCQQENMDAPSRSTWKTIRLFFSRRKNKMATHISEQNSDTWYSEMISVLPDNKPRNRDFVSPLLSVVVVLWRMERMLRLVLLSACVTVVTHGWTTLLSASPQPNLMLILEPATWGLKAVSLTAVKKTHLSVLSTNAIWIIIHWL